MRSMVIDMNDEQLKTLAELQGFLDGTVMMDFAVAGDERYAFIARTVKRFDYGRLKRSNKAIVLRFLERVSGYSRQQIVRLVKRGGERRAMVKRYCGSRTSFASTYTAADIGLLAQTDTLHGTLSGLATKKLMERAYGVFGDIRYQRLAIISVAHLYNLRQRPSYLHKRQVWTKTRPSGVPIGERRAPAPNNRPGYLRVDSVHQGDQDGVKGVYHINAVDCVTQWQLVACCERISEAFLLPVIGLLLEQFPFQILGFHSDGGSEFVNHDVARLLEKLRIEFTRSRPRHCNDNALVETKNGAVIRKTLGYSHIPQRFAKPINEFYADHLNPYLNLHRPCLYATEFIDPEGRRRRAYKSVDVQTPLEKLSAMPAELVTFKPGISLQSLQTEACRMTDHEADLMGNGKLGSASTARVRVCA